MFRRLIVVTLAVLCGPTAAQARYLHMTRATAAIYDYGLQASPQVEVTNCVRVTSHAVRCDVVEQGVEPQKGYTGDPTWSFNFRALATIHRARVAVRIPGWVDSHPYSEAL